MSAGRKAERARRARTAALVQAIENHQAIESAREAHDWPEYARLLQLSIRSATAERDALVQDHCVGGRDREREEMATALGVSLAAIDQILQADPLR